MEAAFFAGQVLGNHACARQEPCEHGPVRPRVTQKRHTNLIMPRAASPPVCAAAKWLLSYRRQPCVGGTCAAVCLCKAGGTQTHTHTHTGDLP